MLLNKYLLMVQKQIICFFRVHLAERVLKVKNQLLLCQGFLIRKCLIFILCVVDIALVFGIEFDSHNNRVDRMLFPLWETRLSRCNRLDCRLMATKKPSD